MTEIGAPRQRKEDVRLLAGRGRYVDDLAVAHMVHAAFVRSVEAHADITAIDASAARRAPGVVAVLTGTELLDRLPLIPTAASEWAPPRRPLTGDRVHYAGEPVALVLASSKARARDAALLVDVAYEPLPVVLDAWAALDPGAPLVHAELETNKFGEIHRVVGDPDTAFADAACVVRGDFRIQRVSHASLEPRAILAIPEVDMLTVWLSCQSPHTVRTWIADIFDMPESRLRIVAPDVGGGFGGKLDLFSDEIAVMWAARELGIPIKWCETRTEAFMSSCGARDQSHRTELALDADGRIRGLRNHFVGDLGAYFHYFTPVVPDLVVDTATGNYMIENVDLHLERVLTNKMSIEALRGTGRGEATYVLERLLDRAARELGIDPLELRLRNLIPPERLPYTTVSNQKYDGGDYPGMLRRAAELLGYDRLRDEQARARDEGRYLGIGFATYNLLAGFSPSGHDWNPMKFFPGHETALVRVDPHGDVTLYSGLCPQGQGSDTSLAQVVADTLQVPFESITVVHGDTALIPYGGGTHGSRGAVVGAHAALVAAQRALEKAKKVAAELLEAAAEDLEFDAGRFSVAGSDSGVTWREVAEEAHFLKRCGRRIEAGLEGIAFYDPEDVNYAFGANAALVEVDAETGAVRVLRFVSVDDAGVVLNPRIVAGQIHGGIAQGIGQALYEDLVYDDAGQVPTSNFASYLLPSAVEMPELILEQFSTPSATPLGTRGVGESGTLASTPAVVNAVEDALAPFGARFDRTPLHPDRVWELLHPA